MRLRVMLVKMQRYLYERQCRLCDPDSLKLSSLVARQHLRCGFLERALSRVWRNIRHSGDWDSDREHVISREIAIWSKLRCLSLPWIPITIKKCGHFLDWFLFFHKYVNSTKWMFSFKIVTLTTHVLQNSSHCLKQLWDCFYSLGIIQS